MDLLLFHRATVIFDFTFKIQAHQAFKKMLDVQINEQMTNVM